MQKTRNKNKKLREELKQLKERGTEINLEKLKQIREIARKEIKGLEIEIETIKRTEKIEIE